MPDVSSRHRVHDELGGDAMTDELTVAKLIARECGHWPAVDPDEPRQPRHELVPRPGELLDWFAAAAPPPTPAPRAVPGRPRPTVDYLDDETPALVRGYVRRPQQ